MKGKETNRRNIELKLVKLIAKESKIKESKITADGDCSLEIKRRLLLGRKVMTNLDSYIKNQRHDFDNKCLPSQGYGFPSGHVWM